MDGVVELPSGPTAKFVDQVRKMVETASDYGDVALALKAAVAVDPARVSEIAAAVAAKAHDASERELESASTKALDDLAASTESDDAQALRSAPTNADVALRRAARSLRERAAPLEPFLSKDDSVATRTAKSEAWLRSIIEARGGLQPCLLYTSPSPRDS